MTDQPNWAEAPPDATHWGPENAQFNEHWYRFYGQPGEMRWHYWLQGVWLPVSAGMPERRPQLIARPGTDLPAPPTWDGQGLPPVGVTCEYLWNSKRDEYFAVLILAHDQERAVFRWLESERKGLYGNDVQRLFEGDHWNFRPIPTAEQRATEQALTELERLYSEGGPAAIYDAGWRKTAE